MRQSVLLGVDIGGTNTKLGLVTSRGKLVAHDMLETRASEGPEQLFSRAADMLPDLIGHRGVLEAAGVGCAGLVDVRRGRLLTSPNLKGWENTPLTRIARDVFGVYTNIDNDANAAAYGEYMCGGGKGAVMLVCVTLGTGVGGGIVDRGKILRGSRNYAGELGHMTINERGPTCRCGNRGCLEAYVGSYSLVKTAKRLWKRHGGSPFAPGVVITPEQIARSARKGDEVSREVFDRAAMHLGTALAALVNLLNPDVICVSGGVAHAFGRMKRRIDTEVSERAFTEAADAVTIKRGLLGFNAATIGSALLARDAGEEKTRRASGRKGD